MQGAVGEAAAMGNVKVWVNDEDLDQAKSIIEEWDNAGYAVEDAQLFDEDDELVTAHEPEQGKTGSTVLVASFFLILVLIIFASLIEF
jgi:hypothetical protein